MHPKYLDALALKIGLAAGCDAGHAFPASSSLPNEGTAALRNLASPETVLHSKQFLRLPPASGLTAAETKDAAESSGS
jgi:hypothetical protein